MQLGLPLAARTVKAASDNRPSGKSALPWSPQMAIEQLYRVFPARHDDFTTINKALKRIESRFFPDANSSRLWL